MSDIRGPQNVKGSWDIVGTAGNDNLYGGKGDNRFDGGAGDDNIYPGATPGATTGSIDGGSGVDTVFFGTGFARTQVEFDSASSTYKVFGIPLKDIEYIDFGDIKLKVEDAINLAGTQHHYTDGDDQLISNDFGYMLEGGYGNDTFTGNGGDDTLYGGKGEDTAVFRGNRADYDIRYDYRSYQYIVTDRHADRDGSDKVVGIEQLKFADTTIQLHGVADYDSQPDRATLAKLDGVIEVPPPPPVTNDDASDLISVIGTWEPSIITDFVIEPVIAIAIATTANEVVYASHIAAEQLTLTGLPTLDAASNSGYLLDTP